MKLIFTVEGEIDDSKLERNAQHKAIKLELEELIKTTDTDKEVDAATLNR